MITDKERKEFKAKHKIKEPLFTWENWSKPSPVSIEEKQWILSRPKFIQQMIKEFPPHCKVKAKEDASLLSPGPGEFAVIYGYTEDGLLVVVNPDLDFTANCKPEWLEVVKERPGFTKKDIEEILKSI